MNTLPAMLFGEDAYAASPGHVGVSSAAKMQCTTWIQHMQVLQLISALGGSSIERS